MDVCTESYEVFQDEDFDYNVLLEDDFLVNDSDATNTSSISGTDKGKSPPVIFEKLAIGINSLSVIWCRSFTVPQSYSYQIGIHKCGQIAKADLPTKRRPD